jgi:hypothetical protein
MSMTVFSAFDAILSQRRNAGDGAAATRCGGKTRREGLDYLYRAQQTLPGQKRGDVAC